MALVLGGLHPHSCAAAAPEEATQKCRQQLQLLAEALGNYRQEHGGFFPRRLRDLCPRYISSLNLLVCPAAWEHGVAGTDNPHLIVPGEADGEVIGYSWEMSQADPPDWEGKTIGMSFAQYKDLQRKSLVGKQVPVIRCSHHGEGHVLNLTEDGRIYESGEYWECNFVDQISGVRFALELVEKANQRISELVRPRPSGATESMLDLRPWYNARFEDPWVKAAPSLETLQDIPGSKSGVVVSRGVSFDAAGIIQLNGKINPEGEWQGFTRLVYPTAVKSISIKRCFRVIHVLGAVQFKDASGTIVATVDIHRTGSATEKWNWRYGVDVLSYRFVPGSPEPGLESTAVAWTGSFVPPEAQLQKPRLFHLQFKTAEPGVAVDHLDFRAGEGFSSAFIAAITLE